VRQAVLPTNEGDRIESQQRLELALSRHSKIADGLPLSVEKRSCSGHHCNDGI